MKAKRPQDSKEDKNAEYANPHNGAKAGEIAQTVLMPGDPLRAKFIAETYLENPKMLQYRAEYAGLQESTAESRFSVMGSGMGMPSIGIYSYELFHFYGVENIIRIGTAGGIARSGTAPGSDRRHRSVHRFQYAAQYRCRAPFAPTASFALLESVAVSPPDGRVPIRVGNVLIRFVLRRR